MWNKKQGGMPFDLTETLFSKGIVTMINMARTLAYYTRIKGKKRKVERKRGYRRRRETKVMYKEVQIASNVYLAAAKVIYEFYTKKTKELPDPRSIDRKYFDFLNIRVPDMGPVIPKNDPLFQRRIIERIVSYATWLYVSENGLLV